MSPRTSARHRPFLTCSVLLAAATASWCAGCGDTSATATDAGITPACSNPIEPLNPTTLIDDFEDGDSAIATVAGRTGGWYSYGDATVGGVIQPTGNSAPEQIPGGRGSSARALHITSTGFLDWGSGVTTALHWGPDAAGVPNELPYDGHLYKGVTFFARIGDTSSSTVRVQVEDQHARPEAGLCVLMGSTGQQCYDGFGMDLPGLNTTWQAYKIPFATLTQRGFGLLAPALDTTNLYDLQFLFPGSAIMDFWLDDVRFYE